MYDPKEENRKAVQHCLRAAYSNQSGGTAVPEAMRRLLDRLSTRTTQDKPTDR